MTSLRVFLHNATRSRSTNEDRARREFIFNVLCLGALGILLAGIIEDTVHRLIGPVAMHQADSLSSLFLYGLFTFFAFLYGLSLRGRSVIASFLLLATLFDLSAYMGFRWGVDVTASLLFYALTITMSGILISAAFGFVTALLAGIAIGITVHLHGIGYVLPQRSWILESWRIEDVLLVTIIFLVIALVMWLSNREVERSLRRARQSEAELKLERDSLEIRVEDRTRELRQAELERMTQAYRFVEFGRIASGLFHDLVNPLAGLTLNIDRIANASVAEISRTDDVERAKLAAQHMQDLLSSMRRHLKRESHEEWFSVQATLQGALRMIATTARERKVECVLEAPDDIQLYGDEVALTQAILNILGNAVQSYPAPDANTQTRFVHMALSGDGAAMIRISDSGAGIEADNLSNIFEPYFTTKGSDGIGLGLSLSKRIIEKDFNGGISVESAIGSGTIFTLYLPQREP